MGVVAIPAGRNVRICCFSQLAKSLRQSDCVVLDAETPESSYLSSVHFAVRFSIILNVVYLSGLSLG